MKTYSILKSSLLMTIFFSTISENIFCQIGDSLTYKIQEFEHMTIVTEQVYGKIREISISSSNSQFSSKWISEFKDSKSFDYSPVIEIIDNYSKEGWEIISSNMVSHSENVIYTYYFLKRQKNIKASM